MKVLRLPFHSDDAIYASHQLISDNNIKKQISSDTFEFLDSAYKYIGGLKSFSGEDDMVGKSYLWYITYDGELNDISEFDIT